MASAGERACARRRGDRNHEPGARRRSLDRDHRRLARTDDPRPHDDRRRVDPRGAALQRLRGPREARPGGQGRAPARGVLEGVGERPRVHVRPAQGRPFPERRLHDGERRRLQLRACAAAAVGQAASPCRRHGARAERQGRQPDDRARVAQAPQQRLAVRDGGACRRDPRQEGRRDDRDEAGRHRAVLGHGVHIRVQRHADEEPVLLGCAGRASTRWCSATTPIRTHR